MKEKVFKAGDKVCGNFIIPEGIEIHTFYNELENKMYASWFKNGVLQLVNPPYAPGLVHIDDSKCCTEEKMTDYVISGVISKIKNQQTWGVE